MDGSIHCYKAHLVACGFSQQFKVDYEKTLSLVVCLNLVCILLSLVLNQDWSLHQVDISNAFLYGELSKDVDIEQPLGYVVEGEFGKVYHLG